MPDVPAGHGQRRLDVLRRQGLQARVAVLVEGDEVLDRLLEMDVDQVEDPQDGLVALDLDVPGVEPCGRVQPEERERVHPLHRERPHH